MSSKLKLAQPHAVLLTVLIALIISGSAIYVFCVTVDQNILGLQTVTNLSFILDDDVLHEYDYVQIPFNERDFLYNHSVYSNTALGSAASLPNQKHNLTVIVQGNILFDYAVYT